MTRYALTVKPHSSLFVGGYAEYTGQSDGDSASDPYGLLLPGSAAKGALREAATRLVNGAGKGEAELQQLFGVEKGPPWPADRGTRDHLLFEGRIRVTPLRAELPEDPGGPTKTPPRPHQLSLRHHVSLERATRQAVPQRLFQNRVTPAGQGLVFRGEIRTQGELSPEQEGLLRAAARLTDQIGGGRGRGLGYVEMILEKIEQPPPTRCFAQAREFRRSWPQAGVHSLVLEFEAEEPLQLGVVKDASNLVTSKEFIDGSALRGAVAAFVAHAAPASEVKSLLEDLMGNHRPVEFGDACAGHPAAIPAPLTLWESKGGAESPWDLAAHLATGKGPHRYFDRRPAQGTWIPQGDQDWRKQRLQRRTVTRTARNVIDGRGDEGKLFSLEVIDPMTSALEPLRFYAPVKGTADQLHWVVRAAEEGIQVGKSRTRGFGRLRLVGVAGRTERHSLAERHRRWVALLRDAGCEAPEAFGVFFALGPIALSAERLARSLGDLDLEVVSGSARRRAHGGWNRKAGLPRNLSGHFVPGSTWIVRHNNQESALDALTRLEEQGLGPGRADGRGRVAVVHDLHMDTHKEDKP